MSQASEPRSFLEDSQIQASICQARKYMLEADFSNACNFYADALELVRHKEAVLGQSLPCPSSPSLTQEPFSSSTKKNIHFEEDELSEQQPHHSEHSNADELQDSATMSDEEDEEDGEQESGTYSDLELAWEVLDCARYIYGRDNSGERASELRLADVYVALGDVGMESDTFEVASVNYKQALAIKQNWHESDDRVLSELHYKTALSLEYNKNEIEAIQHIQEALSILKARAKKLDKYISSSITSSNSSHFVGDAGGSSTVSPPNSNVHNLTLELEELFSLYPELEAKIEELKKSSLESLRTKESNSSSQQQKDSPFEDTSSIKATDVSGLIKRKQAPDQTATTATTNAHPDPEQPHKKSQL